MYRFVFLLALPACTISTSAPAAYPRPTTAHQPTAAVTSDSGSPPGTGQNAPVLDERARLYEKGPLADEPARPLDPTPRDCSARANHCMRDGWMISGGNNRLNLEWPAVPVAPRGGEWIAYDGTLPDAITGTYHTVPATAAQLSVGRRVFVLVPEGAWPRSEAEMLASRRWFEVSVRSVDAAAGTFTVGDLGTFPISSARVLDETRPTR